MNVRIQHRVVAPLALVAFAMGFSIAWGQESTSSSEPSDERPRVTKRADKDGAEAPARATRTKERPPVPSAEEIAGWIAALDDNRYLVREEATARLLEARAAALDPLLAAANGNRPEPADRAVWVLRRLAGVKELALRRQSLDRLVLLQNRPQVAAAAREALAEMRHNEAVQAIQQLGGKIASPYSDDIAPHMAGRVVIDHGWRGGEAGLAHLRDLIGLRHVIIIGTEISLKGLSELRQVELLDDLWLYGTKLQDDDISELQKLLPQVTIDYRRGALLGVGSHTPDGMGPAVVGVVQPGSVAAAAGIQVGDVIQKFENQPVPSFKALTTMIGKHTAGDEVTLEVLRGGQPIQFKIKLGQWETIN